MELEELVLQIRVVADGAEAAIDGVRAALGSLDTANRQSGDTAQENAKKAEEAYAEVGKAASAAFQTIVAAVESGINAYNRYVAAMQGLKSVASGQGIGSDAIQDAVEGLKDAFFDTTSAAAALKNLLSRGYSLDQAVSAITRLKDAAAFGRQSSLSLSDAVVSATEGIKNENSTLVDNAGVTKNVAKMWEEYAAKIGVSAASLTAAQKVEAEYQGIMAETAFQVGDLAKLSDTLAGSQAEAAASAQQLTQSFGEAMAPAVGAVTEAWNGFLGAVKSVVEAMPNVAAGATTAVIAITGLTIAGGVALGIKKLYDALVLAAGGAEVFGEAVSIALPWLIPIIAALGVAAYAYSAYTREQEASAKAAEEAARKAKEENQQRIADNKALSDLSKRYDELTSKKRLSYKDAVDLRNIEQELESKYGITINTLGTVAEQYDAVTKAIQNKITANEAEIHAQQAADMSNLIQAQANAAYKAQTAAEQAADRQLEIEQKRYDLIKILRESQDYIDWSDTFYKNMQVFGVDTSQHDATMQQLKEYLAKDQAALDAYNASVKDEEASIVQTISDANTAWKTVLDMRLNIQQVAYGKLDSATAKLAKQIALQWFGDSTFNSADAAVAAIDRYTAVYVSALNTADVGPIQAALDAYFGKISAGESLSDSEWADFQKKFQAYRDDAQEIGKLFGDAPDVIDAAIGKMFAGLPRLENGFDDVTAVFAEFRTTVEAASIDAIKAMSDVDRASGMDALKKQVGDVAKSYSDAAQEIQKVKDALAALDKVREAQAAGKAFDSEEVQNWIKQINALPGVYIASYRDIDLANKELKDSFDATRWDMDINGNEAFNTTITSIQKWTTALKEQQAALTDDPDKYDKLTEQLAVLSHLSDILTSNDRLWQVSNNAKGLADSITGVGDAAGYSKDAIKAMTSDEKATGMEALKKQVDGVAASYSDAIAEMQKGREVFKALDELKKNRDAGVSFGSENVQALAKTVSDYTNVMMDGYDDIDRASSTASTKYRAFLDTTILETEKLGDAQKKQVQIWIDALEEQNKSPSISTDEYSKNEASIKNLTTWLNLLTNSFENLKAAEQGTYSASESESVLSAMTDQATKLTATLNDSAQGMKDVQDAFAALGNIKNARDQGMAWDSADVQSWVEQVKKVHDVTLDSYADIDSANSMLVNSFASLSSTVLASAGEYDVIISALQEYQNYLISVKADMDATNPEYATLGKHIDDLQGLMDGLAAASSHWNNMLTTSGVTSIKSAQEILDSLTASVKKTGETLHDLKIKQDAINSVKKMVDKLVDAKGAGAALTDKIKEKLVPLLGEDLPGTAGEAATALQNMSNGVKTSIGIAASDLDTLATKVQDMMSALQANSELTVDVRAQGMNILQGLLDMINAARAGAGLPPIGSPSKGGGGGGKSKYQSDIDDLEHLAAMSDDTTASLKKQLAALEALDKKYRDRKGKSTLNEEDQRDLEERIHDAREALRKQELQDDLDLLDHKKQMGELTVQQEIDMLERIKREHKLTADEIMDIDEQIYAAQQQLQQDQADSLDNLAEGIIEALRNRYDAMREAELDALDASRDAWKQWEEDNVAAIQGQIDALDKLSETEDRESKDAEQLRKIAKLQESLTYEQDAYNRAQLQTQLDAAIAEREKTQADWARKDQKDALQAQIEAIHAQADAQQDALDAQEDAINDQYDHMTTDLALQAQAQQMLMAGNQQAILDLIAEYAPEYNATGQSLGEQWLDGFTAAIGGGIEAWFNTLNDQLTQLQEHAMAVLADAASSLNTPGTAAASGAKSMGQKGMASAVTYQQTNNFNQPIETPSDVTRALKRSNEQLAQLVLQGG